MPAAKPPPQRSGKLTLVEDLGRIYPTENSRQKYRMALYKCDCGNPELVRAIASNVRKGNTTSCGKCLEFEQPDSYGTVESQCLICGKTIITKKHRIRDDRGKYCSKTCLAKAQSLEAQNRNIGFKYPDSSLTAISFFHHPTLKDKGYPQLWVVCKCDCGGTHEGAWSAVHMGLTKYCPKCRGQRRSERMSSLNDTKGQKFGRLTIVDYLYVPGNKGANCRYICSCECGTTNYKVRPDALFQGRTKSCGCLNRGRDSYNYFHSHKEWAKRYCELYFVEVDNGPFLKFGIADKTEKRGKPSHGNYTRIINKTVTLNRAECWCIENLLLIESKKYFPSREVVEQSGIGSDYDGRTELRYGLDENEWNCRINELVGIMNKCSWRSFHKEYLRGKIKTLQKDQFKMAIESGLIPDFSDDSKNE